MNHGFRVISIGLTALLAAASLSSADVLHLKRGGRLEGVLTQETEASLTIDIGMGQVSVPRNTVIRIERKESALSEYRNRLAGLAPGDVQAYLNLARFAGASGLHGEARQMLARVISLEPGNVEAHLALGHVLIGGSYVDEEEANRARGLVYFDGRWMTPAEQASLLRQREDRAADDRRVTAARREAREAEDRARRAEAEAARARAESAASRAYPIGYGSGVIVSAPWGANGSGCIALPCPGIPQIWPVPPAAPMVTPLPQARPVQPSRLR